ncbi:F-box domain-containing protein [Mytilinidion resinicola]|uniref:F-box domain-containing protein n=1 Tax=Mytilinidion resinicola TaxID=574789 RepID=A0A6A6YT30_9PEZI|nr:F-box domain-containing protein [Mytilinidion resinicola]KAF2811679.1 F-box domain-containing protein [Mytilinidion resinicola]
MVKRAYDEGGPSGRAPKVPRHESVDRLSQLSDELLLRILSFVPTSTLGLCQRLSHKFRRIAGDSQLWKAVYYNRFVRPRASRLPGIKDPSMSSNHLFYSSKLSKWLDDEHLVRRGQETNWKRQYKLRHNWSQGKCAVREISVTEKPPVPPLIVSMHEGIVYTVDSIAGLRAWSSKKDRKLIASVELETQTNGSPTSLAVDTQELSMNRHRLVVGFEDGHFSVYELQVHTGCFLELYHHPQSSNGMLSAVAYASPYLVTMTEGQLLSLYKFPEAKKDDLVQDLLDPPQLLHSLRSHTVSPPLSLTIRPASGSIIASIAYSVPTYLSGWSVGIQEMRLTSDGELIESRLASAANDDFHSLARSGPFSSLSTRPSSPNLVPAQGSSFGSRDAHAKPTSLSYSHPYLLVSHPDNTLTLYLVTSTSSSLSIGPGSRLWGHTSSVSGAHVGGRGKAVSVSNHGDELRVWELEGGMASSATRRKLVTGELSVRLRPENGVSSQNLDAISDAILQRGFGLGLALEHKMESMSVTRGWVGFDDENVIVLREKSQGSQALVVYDFT